MWQRYTVILFCCVVFVTTSCSRGIAGFRNNQNLSFQFDFVEMDTLKVEQQEALRKNSTERLRLMAARTGQVMEEELETLDRTALLEVVAKGILAKEDEEKGAVGGVVMRRESEKKYTARELELQLELKKLEMEDRRRTMELEVERRRMELEDARAQREHEWRMAQANQTDGQSGGGGVDETGEDAAEELGVVRVGVRRRNRAEVLADRVKRYGSALKLSLIHI